MTSPYGPIVLIANARSGKGAVQKVLDEVTEALTRRELEHEVRVTEYAGHATVIARQALDEGRRFLVA
ncbi:MAG TPA: acylglycerol kinase family protein, partial [Actinomycetota bacterium]|nr:acylglycerol kinase family protein [Actinomycetota bacterium]